MAKTTHTKYLIRNESAVRLDRKQFGVRKHSRSYVDKLQAVFGQANVFAVGWGV